MWQVRISLFFFQVNTILSNSSVTFITELHLKGCTVSDYFFDYVLELHMYNFIILTS